MLGGAIVAGIILLAFFALALWSQSITPVLGALEGKLQPCPDSPNCVCSESYPNRQKHHDIDPVTVSGTEMGRAWGLLRDAIEISGGDIVSETDNYLHAEFSTKIFRFVDDVEIRLDRNAGEIHLRSASRIGHSDLGANRKRIETIWSNFGNQQ